MSELIRGSSALESFSFWLPALFALLSVVTVRGLRQRLREIADGLAKSPANLRNGSRALAEVLPNAELRELEGTHSFRLEVLAPVLADCG